MWQDRTLRRGKQIVEQTLQAAVKFETKRPINVSPNLMEKASSADLKFSSMLEVNASEEANSSQQFSDVAKTSVAQV